jgi:hypothetical protein
MELMDSEGRELSRFLFYKVHIFSSPHIFVGLTEDSQRAVFRNYEGAEWPVSCDEVPTKVRPYPPDEYTDFVSLFLNSEDTETREAGLRINRFVEKNCKRYRDSQKKKGK